MGLSPLVGLLGHRQVGKTTLLEKVGTGYSTLDQEVELSRLQKDLGAYLRTHSGRPFAIDEAQLEPRLFPALKEWVRKHKKPGQFLLSGSVRFTSRQAIRESLTGRILNLELFPMVLSELQERPLPHFLTRLLEGPVGMPERLPSALLKSRLAEAQRYLTHGGLPGVCFIRDDSLRALKIDEQLRTILDRDLRLLFKTSVGMAELTELLRALALSQGSPIEWKGLASITQISTPTLKKLVDAFESLFLIRRLPIQGGRKGLQVFLEDMGEAHFLRSGTPSFAAQATHLFFCHFRAEFEYRAGARAQAFVYRTRGGAHLPLAYRTPLGYLGVLPIQEAADVRSALSSVNSFLKTYSGAKVILPHPGTDLAVVQPNVLLVPYGYCL